MSLSPGPSEQQSAWMLVPASPERFDGIRDYASHLAGALLPDQRAWLLTTREDAGDRAGWRALNGWRDLTAIGPAPRVLYLHYQPASWLRRDVPSLLRALDALRARGTKVLIVFHEYQLDPAPGTRRLMARIAFRRLGRAVAKRAHALIATYGFVAGGLKEDGLDRYAPIVIIPVGSNIPVAAAAVQGLPSEAAVMFGQPAGMNAAFVREAAAALRAAGKPALRWVCRSRDEATAWRDTAGIPTDALTLCPALDAGAVSAELTAAPVAFAPIVDGVSTRRTTVAACLQHGLPIVGTHGRATDAVFRDSAAFSLAPIGDPTEGARRLLHLIDHAAVRERMSAEARRLFDERLSWPRIARRFLVLVD